MITHTINISALPSIPTDTLDEDLYFIRDSYLIGYGITINIIKIKYYTLDGLLLQIK
jgi:hypothetical protein